MTCMTFLRPTLIIDVYRKLGSDAYGQARWQKLAPERVAPVRLSFQLANTTVRTDSAGTKGHAQEPNAKVVLLALPTADIRLDDKLVVMGRPLRVIEVHPRFAVTGALDHYEIRCMAWS